MFAITPPPHCADPNCNNKVWKRGVTVEPHKFVSFNKFLGIEFRSTSIYTLDIEKQGKES